MELFLIGNKGIYMENDSSQVKAEDSSAALEAINIRTSDGDELEDDDNFMQLLENLGGQNVFQEWAYICKRLPRNQSVTHFGTFVF